jgi:hypothetical protein
MVSAPFSMTIDIQQRIRQNSASLFSALTNVSKSVDERAACRRDALAVINKLKMALVVLLMAASLSHADDASIKKQLLGYWKSPRHGYLLKSNGIMYMLPRPDATTTNTWDVRNGFFYQDGEALKIVALNKYNLCTSKPAVIGSPSPWIAPPLPKRMEIDVELSGPPFIKESFIGKRPKREKLVRIY